MATVKSIKLNSLKKSNEITMSLWERIKFLFSGKMSATLDYVAIEEHDSNVVILGSVWVEIK
ncbi:hypothetical protein [Ralstonia phage RP13]|nr:hypothetical protein [Ralstonia phage RP13]